MRKKIYLNLLAIILVVVFSIGFPACGGSDNDEGKDYDWRNMPNDDIAYDNSDENIGLIQISGAVDLGLSVKWGACNIGASAPQEFGGYYAWGEIQEKPYNCYDWNTYIHCWGNSSSISKYNSNDKKTQLELADDIAFVKLGGSWRIPTSEEIVELIEKCASERTTYKGISGYLFTAQNGNKIFLPQAGHCWTRRGFIGTYGDYWTSTADESISFAKTLRNDYLREDYRYNGMSIRPVKE